MLQIPLTREQIEGLNQDSVIDMSVLNFNKEEVKDDVKSSLIFLRNTEVEVNLDFSKCSYETKKCFLLSYLTLDIRVTIKELASSWAKILCGKELNTQCILLDCELELFQSEHEELLLEISQFLKSIPSVCLSVLQDSQGLYEDDFERTDVQPSFSLYNLASLFRYMNLPLYIDTPNNTIYTGIPCKESKYVNEILLESGYLELYGLIFKSTPEDLEAISDKLREKIKEDNNESIC